MRTLLTITAAALCISYAGSGVASDEAAQSLSTMQRAGTYGQPARLDTHRAELVAEAPWEVGHHLALIVAQRESRRPGFDVSASVVFLENAH